MLHFKVESALNVFHCHLTGGTHVCYTRCRQLNHKLRNRKRKAGSFMKKFFVMMCVVSFVLCPVWAQAGSKRVKTTAEWVNDSNRTLCFPRQPVIEMVMPEVKIVLPKTIENPERRVFASSTTEKTIRLDPKGLVFLSQKF